LSLRKRLPDRAHGADVPTRASRAVHTARMDDEHARELLAAERARIEHALGAQPLPKPEDTPDVFEAADVAEDMFDAEVAEEEAEQLRAELEAIARAEQRLAQGTYGVSIESGEPIPDARLQAIPWAERTAEEQARYEASGG